MNMMFDGQPARLIPRDDWQQPLIGERTYKPPAAVRYWFEGIVEGAVKVGDERTVSCAGKTWNVRVTQVTVFADPGSPLRSIVSLEVLS